MSPRRDPKDIPAARIAEAPIYEPDLEAYGLKRQGEEIVPILECPDRSPAEIMKDPKAIVSARLWEGKFDKAGRLQESRTTDRLTRRELVERYTPLREQLKLSESDWFSLGSFGSQESPLTSNYVPMIPGPATRQQYWADYWASSAKTFEASTHSGVARRACRAMVQFTIGKGVQWKIENTAAKDAWEAFWEANRMRRRFKAINYDLSVFGEQFLRYFPAPRNNPGHLIVRQLDPATIYEIVTAEEDIEQVFFYHQQYQTRQQLYPPPAGKATLTDPTLPGVTRYIIRQIDAAEIDHWKINDVSGEARGRSLIFPALGDLKRLRDLMTSKVIQSDVGNRVMAILKANGTGADLTRVLNTIFPNGQPPAPGTVVALNEATDLEPFQYTQGREVRADFTYDELIDGICASVEIARPYLGLSPAQGSGTTQASSLTTVEPSVKAFEERQELEDEMLHQMFDRVMEAAGINGEVEVEFIFPEIAKEDRSKLLEDLEMSEGNDWISKRTAASTAAAQLGLTDYDFDDEQKAIVEEFKDSDETDGTDELTGADKPARGEKIRRPMIRATSRQVPKMDPTKAQVGDDEPMGLLVGGPAGAGAPNAPGAPGGAQSQGQGGLAGNKNPAARSNNIARKVAEALGRRRARNRREPDDPEFTEHADEFAAATAEHLERLIDDVS